MRLKRTEICQTIDQANTENSAGYYLTGNCGIIVCRHLRPGLQATSYAVVIVGWNVVGSSSMLAGFIRGD